MDISLITTLTARYRKLTIARHNYLYLGYYLPNHFKILHVPSVNLLKKCKRAIFTLSGKVTALFPKKKKKNIRF